MKIAYNILGTFNSAGMERVLSNKANFLVKSGHNITIITTDQKNRNPFYKLDERINLIDLGINYTDNSSKWMFKKILTHLYKIKKHENKLREILFNINADIVISMFNNDAQILYKIKDNSKKILESHFAKVSDYTIPRKGLYNLVDKYRAYSRTKIVSKYDKFVVLTHEDKNLWGNMPYIDVIPNANTFESSEYANLTSKIAIAIGRYEYQKGFDDLIKIWAMVNKKYPDWKLNIFGDGSQKEYLQNLINNLKLSNTIRLSHTTKNVKEEYLKSSMLIMTSKFEGLPMSLLEAQVCGLPLVSYNCKCGPKDIVKNNENGFLVNQGDTNEMANKIIELIENENLRIKMGQKSIELSENFSETKIMKYWIQLFNKMISNENSLSL